MAFFFILNCLALAKDNLIEKLVLIKEYQDRSIISLKFIHNLTMTISSITLNWHQCIIRKIFLFSKYISVKKNAVYTLTWTHWFFYLYQ